MIDTPRRRRGGLTRTLPQTDCDPVTVADSLSGPSRTSLGPSRRTVVTVTTHLNDEAAAVASESSLRANTRVRGPGRSGRTVGSARLGDL